jgi:hypothetical protein
LKNQLQVNSQAYDCTISSASTTNCTTPVALSLLDSVWASINLDSDVLVGVSTHAYQNKSDALTNFLPINALGLAVPTVKIVVIASYIQSPELQADFNMTILPSSISLAAYDKLNRLITGMPSTYNQLLGKGAIAFPVKVNRPSNVTGLASCDEVLGCDSFGINTQALFNIAPSISYVIINMTNTLPKPASNSPVKTSVAFELDTALLTKSIDFTSQMAAARTALIALGAAMGGAVVAGGITLVAMWPKTVAI